MIKRSRLRVFAARFSEAFEYASRKHATQVRKGTRTPYVSHVIAVAGLVLEHGGSEEEAIAALLHDVPEDCEGLADLDEIGRKFGPNVAKIVEGCSDTFEVERKPDWKPRKLAYVGHLANASESVLLVSAADKLHNARTAVADYRVNGESFWDRFKTGKELQLWNYRALVKAFRKRGSTPLVDELDRVVTELEQMARKSSRRRTRVRSSTR